MRQNLTGQRYGRLTAIEQVQGTDRTRYVCQCDCGNVVEVVGHSLRAGVSQSCGCLKRQVAAQSVVDRTGQRYGRLTVVKRAGSVTYGKAQHKRATWHCTCECGNTTVAVGT